MEAAVSGVHVWYYFICQREVWLIAHQITPDQEHENLQIGKWIDAESFGREKKSLAVENSRIDVFHAEGGRLVVGEVKKSSRYRDSARMQLAFYLWQLKQNGIDATGELRFPEERERETVDLTPELEQQLAALQGEIANLMTLEQPPKASQNRYCNHCAYAEFCWS